ncbi:SDR family oxidoreductase [Acetobacter sp. TBRC 12305]|uniref:SDR family oxidoreductase n=2 Tax=Acetobacter garciniae TaxID=2817435 RepID=A0A939HNL4_9PROT|nr:SDR family oxidoreductase [Acetobacter garciniae]MBX0344950.1 SDR family oxidoreductase [Acetobacter garciniae]
MPLGGRHAFVTGAGSGIGAAIAIALSEAGAHVSLAGRSLPGLEATASRMRGPHAVIGGFDITCAPAVADGVARARAVLGAVDILVNNAGHATSQPFLSLDATTWGETIALNLGGTFTVTQAILPDLLAHGDGARLINIASTAGVAGYRYVAAYCAAKHGVVGMTRALALEYATTGLTVNAVCPGYAETPMLEQAMRDIAQRGGRTITSVRQQFEATSPQKRLVTPHEIASTVLWLAQPASAAVTGQCIVVAGGEIMAG